MKKTSAEREDNPQELVETKKTGKSLHEYVNLAKNSLEYYIRHNKVIEILDDNLDNYLTENKAGVFVCIKKFGDLRGCIGTIFPQRSSIAEEIIYNAISAGINDYRFDRVEESELDNLSYSVDILKKPEKINSLHELDEKVYGVIVKSRYKTGLLLPNLEGVNSPEEQVEIALKKAGISQMENYSMERFEVIRYK